MEHKKIGLTPEEIEEKAKLSSNIYHFEEKALTNKERLIYEEAFQNGFMNGFMNCKSIWISELKKLCKEIDI